LEEDEMARLPFWSRALRPLVVRLVAATIALVLVALPGRAGAAFVEVNYQDPLTVAPPLQRPATAHCTVRMMEHDFAFSYGHPFIGTFAPPAGCPGPWSMVAMDWNGSIAGRQYDRLAGVWVGGVEMLRLTTPEPDPAGIRWHVEKDVSEYAAVLRQPQPVVVDLGNLVNSTYTGVFHITLDLTFYESDREHPGAGAPSQVVPISTGAQAPGWFNLNTASDAASRALTLPPNLTRARLEVYASSHGCEEQWYTNVPDSYAQKDPQAGLCGGGAFRELQVYVDGVLAGVATPFPVIYSGGLNPFMWRPIPSIEQFNIPPYLVDLTPFVGVLTDGRPHTISIQVANNEGYWPVDGDLLVDQDPHAAATHGAVLENTLQPQARTQVQLTSEQSVDRLVTSADRAWSTEGYVDTSAGRVTTRVEQAMRTVNDQRDTLDGVNVRQVVAQRQHTETTTTVTSDAGHTQVDRVVDDYPLALTEDYSEQTQPNGDHSFTLDSKVDLALQRQTWPHEGDTTPSRLFDHVTASALLVRDTVTRANLAADGQDSERYVSSLPGACYDHLLEASHGWVTQDQLRHDCRSS
jgi:Peptide N-acetyl-beta-D-glucosaminyl asparaginase amidase A